MSSAPLVCAALGIEARTVRKGWPGADVAVVGMKAPRLHRVEAHDGPVYLLGFGGGLGPSQQPGDVVVATEIRDSASRTKLPAASEAQRLLHRAGVTASGGVLWCSDAIVRGAARKKLAKTASAVDMESARVAAACDAQRLVVVRVIVDTPTRGLLRASIFGGRRAKRVLRQVAAAFATSERPARIESITSGTVGVAVQSSESHASRGK